MKEVPSILRIQKSTPIHANACRPGVPPLKTLVITDF